MVPITWENEMEVQDQPGQCSKLSFQKKVNNFNVTKVTVKEVLLLCVSFYNDILVICTYS